MHQEILGNPGIVKLVLQAFTSWKFGLFTVMVVFTETKCLLTSSCRSSYLSSSSSLTTSLNLSYQWWHEKNLSCYQQKCHVKYPLQTFFQFQTTRTKKASIIFNCITLSGICFSPSVPIFFSFRHSVVTIIKNHNYYKF